MKKLLIAILIFVSLVIPATASHSDPLKIQIKECVKIGTTTDPSVKVFIEPLMRVGVPDKDQIFRVKIVIDSRTTLDKTTLLVSSPEDGFVANSELKAKLNGNYYEYEFTLGQGYIQTSSVLIIFKRETSTFAKSIEFGSALLPTAEALEKSRIHSNLR